MNTPFFLAPRVRPSRRQDLLKFSYYQKAKKKRIQRGPTYRGRLVVAPSYPLSYLSVSHAGRWSVVQWPRRLARRYKPAPLKSGYTECNMLRSSNSLAALIHRFEAQKVLSRPSLHSVDPGDLACGTSITVPALPHLWKPMPKRTSRAVQRQSVTAPASQLRCFVPGPPL